jgi:hypothetical protein
MEHWLNKPFVLYAMPDKRHGFVARFKKYYPPVQISDVEALKKLESCRTLEELQHCWTKEISKEEKLLPTIIAKKEILKTTLK